MSNEDKPLNVNINWPDSMEITHEPSTRTIKIPDVNYWTVFRASWTVGMGLSLGIGAPFGVASVISQIIKWVVP